MSMAENCRSFGLAMKEAVKRVTSWAAYYHTSRQSWYPKPEGALLLLQVPVMNPLPIVNMCQADSDALRDWVLSYGAAVRQWTVRQETTMAQHGALPEFMYQRQCEISEILVSIAFDKHDTHADQAVMEHELEEDLSDKFDESSDNEVVNDDSSELTDTTHGEIGSSVTFLPGARSRSRLA